MKFKATFAPLETQRKKSLTGLAKRDLIVVLGCAVFVLANIGAIGSGGRRRAKEAVCLSNLRKWGVCYQMYTNDNNCYFDTGDLGGTHMDLMWVYCLQPYYKEGMLRLCPEAVRPFFVPYGGPGSGPGKQPFASFGALWGPTASSRDDWGDPWHVRFPPSFAYTEADNCLSYGRNDWVRSVHPERRDDPRNLKCWQSPNVQGGDNIPLFMDCSYYCADPYDTDEPPAHEADTFTGSSANEMKRFCVNRHNGAINVLFLDFSVRKVGLKYLWTLKWHREFDNVNGVWVSRPGYTPPWPNWMGKLRECD